MGTDSISRTFIGSVVCIDLVGYSTRSVAQQITIKEAFNRLLAQSLQRVAPDDRIILDTGDGAAVSFLGDPEGGLQCALALRDSAASHAVELGAARGQGAVRIGVNLGPMKVALDLNGYPRIVGDGINVAERIAAFAQPGEIVVSRSFHDMVSRLSEANAALFADAGTRADKNGREHHVFTVTSGRRAPAAAAPTSAASAGSAGGGALAAFLRDRLKVGFAATLLGVLIAVELAVLFFGAARERAPVVANPEPRPAPAQMPPAPASKAEPAPVVAGRTTDFVKLPEPAPQKAEAVAPPTHTKAPETAAAKPAEPGPSKAVDPPRAVVPEPVRTPPAEATRAAPADPPKAAKREEPRKREDPKAAAKREEPPKPAQEPPRPAPEPPREEPKVAVAPPTTIATPVSKAQVSFPAQAMARNIDRGVVKARLTIDAAGVVRTVQILSSYPRRYFDDEASRSLKEWRFNAGADNRTYDVEIEFQR